MSYLFNAPNKPNLNIQDKSEKFPVTRVIGIGRNYAENPQNEEKNKNNVIFFMKDAYMLTSARDGVTYPDNTTQLRYELELIIAIDKEGNNVPVAEADDYIYGYGIGVDFTKYDMQAVAIKNGWPWEKGKTFIGCAPCSDIVSKQALSIGDNTIWLKKNGKEEFSSNLNKMIWKVPEIVSLVSSYFRLLPGDIIFAGTPSTIVMVDKHDLIEGGIDGLGKIHFRID